MFDLNNTDIFNEHCLPTTFCIRKYGELQFLILVRGGRKKKRKERKETLILFRPVHSEMSFADLLSEIGTCVRNIC